MEQKLGKAWKMLRFPIDHEFWSKEVRKGDEWQWEVDLNSYAKEDGKVWHTNITDRYIEAIPNYKGFFDNKFHCKLFFVKIMPGNLGYIKYPKLGETALIWNITNGRNKVSNHKISGVISEKGIVSVKITDTRPLLVDLNYLSSYTEKQRRDLVLTFNAPFEKVLSTWL